MRFQRFDKIVLDRPRAVKLDNGFLRVPARIARVGIQEYRRPDGTVEKAFRPPEEVGKPDSLATFDGVPLLNEHPYAEGGVVTAQNAKRLGVGFVQHPVYKDGFVEASILIEDAEAIAAVESGKVELSAGYFIDREETAGVFDGVSYDFIQKNIQGNHVAIVREGRAGPEVRLQLDSHTHDSIAYSVDFSNTPWFITDNVGHEPTERTKMVKILIDGKETEVPEIVAERLANERAATAKASEGNKAELDKKQALCDGLQEQVTKLQAELKEAPVKIAAEMKATAAIATKAKALVPDLATDGLDAGAIKRAVVAKLSSLKLDEKSDEYVTARFDHYVEQHEKQNPATEAAEKELKEKPVTDGKPQTVADAKAQMLADFFNKGK